MSLQQLDNLLGMMAQNPHPFPINDGPLAIRPWVEIAAGHLPSAEGVSVKNVNCGPCDGGLYLPEGGDASRLIIFYHGGCFVFGSSKTHHVIASNLAKAANCAVLVPNYRLAPEHMAPAAHDDAFKVYKWALADGYRPGKIALSGDSAGGNLAVVVALRAQAAGLPAPAALGLMSPWVDFVGEGASHREVKDDPIITAQLIEMALDAYIGPDDLRSPLFTPLYADLSGLPKVLVHVGGRERLRDDAVSLVDRIKRFGGDAELKIFDGMIHTFQMYAPIVDEGMTSIHETAAFLTSTMA